jgi:hypothetical protein
VDTVENIKMNNAFLVKAENTWAKFCISKFSMIHTPMDTKAMMKRQLEGLNW